MEKPSFLVSWSSSEKEELSLKLIQLEITPTKCIAGPGQVLILTGEGEVFNLDPLQPISLEYKICCVSCNSDVVLMISTCGVALIMGSDNENSGILGIPDSNVIVSPTPIPSLSGVLSKSCGLGKDHAAVIDSEGKLYTWGSNQFNQCGKDFSLPSLVEAASYFTITKLHCGDTCTGFLTSGGLLYTFGRIANSSLCAEGAYKPKDPFIMPDLDYHYSKEFCIGKDFIVVLTEAGQVFLYDDCRVLIKIPVNSEIKSVACSREAVYCAEKKSFVIYEWKFGKEPGAESCNLRNLKGKAYKIGPAKIFSSGCKDMFALVNKETAGKFLFNVDHELTWTVPNKVTVSPVHSPNVKRTPFRALSKEFSLNIDHFMVVKNDAADRIGGILKKWVQMSFRSLWECAFQQDLFKKSLEKNKRVSLAWILQRVCLQRVADAFLCMNSCKKIIKMQRVFTDTFDEFTEHYKTLKNFCLKLEKFYRKQAWLLLQSGYKKHQAYVIRIFVVSVEKVFHKQIAQVFTLLLRECITTKTQKPTITVFSDRLSSLTHKFIVSSSKVHENSSKLMHFGLILQSILEKLRSFNTLRGFRAFKAVFRNMSCLTSSVTFMKSEKNFSESFDKNFNLSNYFKSDQKPRSKKLSTEVSTKKPEKKIFNPDRRHSMFIHSAKKDIKVSSDIRKAYDNQLKSARRTSFIGKNINVRIEQRKKERMYKIACAVLKVEAKMLRMVKRKKKLGFNTIVMAQVEKVVVIEHWKEKVFMLGFHKLALCLKKIIKDRFLSLKIN